MVVGPDKIVLFETDRGVNSMASRPGNSENPSIFAKDVYRSRTRKEVQDSRIARNRP